MKTVRQRLIDDISIAINRSDIERIEPKKDEWHINLYNEKQAWGFSLTLDKNNPQHQELEGLVFGAFGSAMKEQRKREIKEQGFIKEEK